MSEISDLQVGDRISFNIYGTIDNSNNFTGEVAGFIGGAFVPTTTNSDINHANIYPSIPDTYKEIYANDYASYQYLIVVTDNGTTYYIGYPWINVPTLDILGTATFTIILGDFDSNRQTEVLKTLTQKGFVIKSTSLNTGA